MKEEALLKAKTQEEKLRMQNEFLISKYQKKFPRFSSVKNIDLISKEACEQASDESISKIKAKIFTGETLLDITGGLGSDSIAFSNSFQKVTYIEKNETIYTGFKKNINLLGIGNIEPLNMDSVEFLKSNLSSFDFIYVDPNRRATGEKKISFKNQDPNLIENFSLLTKSTRNIIIRATPMTDIKYAEKELGVIFDLIILIEKNNELKEILFCILNNNPFKTKFVSIILNKGNQFLYEFTGKRNKFEIDYGMGEYIYELPPTFSKLGFWAEIVDKYNLKKVAPNTHIFMSDIINKEFPGKIYKVIHISSYRYDHIKDLGITSANIKTRNFFNNPDMIRKKLRIAEGNEYTIFAFKNLKEKGRIAVCKKV